MPNPVLTAVIPVTRMAGKLSHLEPLLKKCIFLGIEVVIVHDEQDPETGNELDEIIRSTNSKMVTLITKRLFSPGKARNLGIEIAKGDWICFWDSDDNPLPENFFEMVLEADQLGHKVAVGKFRQINGKVGQEFGNREIEIGRMPGIWRFAFKNDFIEGKTFPEYKMGEDQVFLGRILIHSPDCFRFEQVVYEYICNNPGQLTKNQKVILDLHFAIEDMMKTISHPSLNNRVADIFLSRQILTLLKNESPKLRLRLIGTLANAVKVGGKSFLFIFLNEFFASLKGKLIFRRSH